MIWVRRLSILFPISLVVFFGAAFVSVWVTPPKKLNQLIIGGIGEAKVLNPILYTTDSEGEVIDPDGRSVHLARLIARKPMRGL